MTSIEGLFKKEKAEFSIREEACCDTVTRRLVIIIWNMSIVFPSLSDLWTARGDNCRRYVQTPPCTKHKYCEELYSHEWNEEHETSSCRLGQRAL